MRYVRTLDSATITIHSAMVDPNVFPFLLKKGIENNCYMLSKDASEDVVSLLGSMTDKLLVLERVREASPTAKGPTYVRTLDLRPEDLVLVHYHCGIAPEPSSIDVDTMTLALRAQILATIPGRPRVFGIASPVQSARSFCIDLAIYEPVPSMSIGYDIINVNVKDFSFLRIKRKAFIPIEYEEDAIVVYGDPCTTPEETCIPYRFGDSPELTLEDFIFIASYRVNTGKNEFIYLKLTSESVKGYAIKIFKLDLGRAVIRGVPWRIKRRASTNAP